MPKALVGIHLELDAAVDACYRPTAFTSDLERLSFLFDLYKQYTTPLIQASEKADKKKRHPKEKQLAIEQKQA